MATTSIDPRSTSQQLPPTMTAEAGALPSPTSLHASAAVGDVNLVRYALESGQSPNAVLQGVSPLHAAASCGDVASVKLLISYGADVDAARLPSRGGIEALTTASTTGPGAPGARPLHFAAANGHADVLRLLLSHGARPCVLDADGVSAETLAIANGHRDCIDVLRWWIQSYGEDGLAAVAPGTSASASTSPRSPNSGALRSQSSLEQLTSNVKATLSAALGRTSSNPSLKTSAARATQQQPTVDENGGPPSDGGDQDGEGGEDDSDLAFSTATTPAGARTPSRRRPSMPSILEKAAHPAQSIRSAWTRGDSHDESRGGTGTSSPALTLAPKGLKSGGGGGSSAGGGGGGSLTGKRSISNFFLRKATTQQAQAQSGLDVTPTSSRSDKASATAAGRGLSLAATWSPRKISSGAMPSPRRAVPTSPVTIAAPSNQAEQQHPAHAPPAPSSPSTKSTSSSPPSSSSRPRRRAQSLVGALQRRPFAGGSDVPPVPAAPLSPTSSLNSNGGNSSSSGNGAFRDMVWQAGAPAAAGQPPANDVSPATAAEDAQEYLGESSPPPTGLADDDGLENDSFLPASLRTSRSTSAAGNSINSVTASAAAGSGGVRNSPRGGGSRLVKLPSAGALGDSYARSRSGTGSNSTSASIGAGSAGSVHSGSSPNVLPTAAAAALLDRQKSSSSLSSNISMPAAVVAAANKAAAASRSQATATGLSTPSSSRHRSNSLAATSSLASSSNSSLRAAFISAATSPPTGTSVLPVVSSEQARNVLLKHAGEFGAGRSIVGEDGATRITLAAQLAAYGEALEREGKNTGSSSRSASMSRSASGASTGALPPAAATPSGLAYRRSRETLLAGLPSVSEHHREGRRHQVQHPQAQSRGNGTMSLSPPPAAHAQMPPAPSTTTTTTRHRSSSDTAGGSNGSSTRALQGRQSFDRLSSIATPTAASSRPPPPFLDRLHATPSLPRRVSSSSSSSSKQKRHPNAHTQPPVPIVVDKAKIRRPASSDGPSSSSSPLRTSSITATGDHVAAQQRPLGAPRRATEGASMLRGGAGEDEEGFARDKAAVQEQKAQASLPVVVDAGRERSKSDSGLLHAATATATAPDGYHGELAAASLSNGGGRPASNSASTGATDTTVGTVSTAPSSVGAIADGGEEEEKTPTAENAVPVGARVG